MKNPDGRIAGRTLADGNIVWSHKFDINVAFIPPSNEQKCSSCGGPLVINDGRWHPVEVRDGRYYCEECASRLS